MKHYFAQDYRGEPFQLFSSPHLIALGILVLLNFLFIRMGMQTAKRKHYRLRHGLAIVILLNEVVWHLWNLLTGGWSIQTMLPFHLCSIMNYVSIATLLTKSSNLYQLCYFLGIGGALQALLTPDLGSYGYPHFLFFQTFLSHSLIITTALYMTIVEGYRPTLRILPALIVGFNLYLLVVAIINSLIGSNYLFIAHKPNVPTILDAMPPWPWYIFGMEGVGILVVLLLYLAFVIVRAR
ncbi:TIGR02206 family membrane protein [Pantanalinema rosaneae CENA516]|uniref:YwaF family protein n=1 Tax=Pantanalinema rosaneae TaxID=1620701 RepID=UPI003D6FC92C